MRQDEVLDLIRMTAAGGGLVPCRRVLVYHRDTDMTRGSSGGKRASRRPQIWLATVATLIGIATGVLTLRDQLFPHDEPVKQDATSIPYFDGIVSHLERSRDFIGFLQNHDADIVKLQAGFQLSLDDFAAKGFGNGPALENGQAYIVLYTECRPPLTAAERRKIDLGFTQEVMGRGRGCLGDELFIGKDTDESGIYVTHGNPRLEGYFRVNIGDMHQGLVGIQLVPVPRGQA